MHAGAVFHNQYHHEMIPTDLLLAIEASREKVPFPSLEILDGIFLELIRKQALEFRTHRPHTWHNRRLIWQAGLRKHVSPILIIISSYRHSSTYQLFLAYSIRIMRFAFIFFGACAGFLGITLGLFLLGIWSAALKSFGVPFMAPLGPRTSGSFRNVMFKAPEWKQEDRPDYLNAKRSKKQNHYSMKWKINKRKNNGRKQMEKRIRFKVGVCPYQSCLQRYFFTTGTVDAGMMASFSIFSFCADHVYYLIYPLQKVWRQ